MPPVPAIWSSVPPMFSSYPIPSQSSEAIMQPVDFLAFWLWVQWCQYFTVATGKWTTPPPFNGVIEKSLDGTVLTWESKTSKTIGP